MSELQERNRAVWSSGNWDAVATLIESVGPHVLDLVGIEPGMDVLDVGTGSGGNVAIPAALRGAQVTGLDLTDEWFGRGRERAAGAGVEIDWVVGDAQDMPLDDASFDRVVSTFGHMFAPDHARAGAELLRVCRPGGIVAFTAWKPEGYTGRMFALLGSFAPAPPPPGFQPPPLWGTADHAREMLAPYEPEFVDGSVAPRFESAESCVDFMLENFGPALTMKNAIGDRADEMREAWIALAEDANEVTDGSWAATQPYLITILRKP